MQEIWYQLACMKGDMLICCKYSVQENEGSVGINTKMEEIIVGNKAGG